MSSPSRSHTWKDVLSLIGWTGLLCGMIWTVAFVFERLS